MWVFAREGLGSSDWYESLWSRRERIKDLPALLLWGLKDPAFGRRYLERWQSLFTHGRTVTYPAVGHFVPDEAGPAAASEIARFLEEAAPATT